ncbi:Hypothetical predicted protein [Pelobates cultripes]|uniref:Uncharacterized protein n=1 Tax=Pelobates cultripes TaxID=61616 RepID=A0AAD1W787_PELCU|nr:Hypothetical predicted protein [Pelobates cultripes]
MSNKSTKKLQQKTLHSHLTMGNNGNQDGADRSNSTNSGCDTGKDQDVPDISCTQPDTDASVSKMLHSLQQSLWSDFSKMAADIKADILALGDRTAHLKRRQKG